MVPLLTSLRTTAAALVRCALSSVKRSSFLRRHLSLPLPVHGFGLLNGCVEASGCEEVIIELNLLLADCEQQMTSRKVGWHRGFRACSLGTRVRSSQVNQC
jgi:hypothetical protein